MHLWSTGSLDNREAMPDTLTESAQGQKYGQELAHGTCHNFYGESLWAPMQLEEEMAAGYWICIRPNGFYLSRLWCQMMPAVLK
jgi:putative AlgH/UPF0301 family transcriptional regulator